MDSVEMRRARAARDIRIAISGIVSQAHNLEMPQGMLNRLIHVHEEMAVWDVIDDLDRDMEIGS